jgi:hypothetical protein
MWLSPLFMGWFKGLIKSLVKANLTFEIIVSMMKRPGMTRAFNGSLSWPGALKYFGCDDCLTAFTPLFEVAKIVMAANAIRAALRPYSLPEKQSYNH